MSHPKKNTGKKKYRSARQDTFQLWRSGELEGNEASRDRSTREGAASRHKRKNPSRNTNVTFTDAGHGILVEQHRRTCLVRRNEEEDLICRYSPSLNLDEYGMLAVGDFVELGQDPDSNEYYLTKVKARESKLSRPGPPDREHREQVLAANIDQVVVVVSLKEPEFNTGFVDRYMMVCEASDIRMSLVVNKIDLDDTIPEKIREFEKYLDRVVYTSVKSSQGLDELRELLFDQTSVLTGQSGVGKSSLIQALLPEKEIRTGVVREGDGKGRHTTTKSTLFEFGKGWMIDTPGIRRLGFWEMDASDLAIMFPFFRDIDQCKFNDCLHLTEPGCSVTEAVDDEIVPIFKYESYLRILDSLKRR